jgi:RNA polymerase subunit RPABC4/transcription elongation factor Spt4
LLRDIVLRRACQQCQAVTEPDWLVCPHCRTELRRLCTACGKPLDLNWVMCPFCATPVAGSQPLQPSLAAHAPAAAVQPIAADVALQRPEAS